MAFLLNKDKNKELKTLKAIKAMVYLYNKTLAKYIVNGGKIAEPTTDVRKLSGKFSTIEDYIQSNPKWIKLRDYYENQKYDFAEWIDVLIGKWSSVIIMLNTPNMPLRPKFDIVMSPKMENIFLQLKRNEEKIKEEQYTGARNVKTKIAPTIEPEINNLLFYHKENPDLDIEGILLTFRRDFGQEFLAVVDKLKEKGYDDERILAVLENKLKREA